jgi:amino acid permease
LGGLSIEWSTTTCLLIITVVAIAPLCLMKNLDALAPYSALGMVAVLCALGAMMVRYFDGSYLEDGLYAEDTPPELSPSFGTDPTPWCSLTLLPFICMVYTSFDMHYNSPRFYSELQDASVPRFTHVVSYSFGITAAIYSAIGVVGFLTFGENSDSYILNNYSPRDSLATLARLAIGLCSLVSYPLNFIGVRDNMLDILGVADQVNTPSKLNAFTLLLLAVLTITSCFVSDLGMINSVGGGTTVTLVCFIFPALMFQEGTRHVGGGFEGGSRGQTRRRREQWLVMVLTVIGVVVGVVGVWASLFYGA